MFGGASGRTSRRAWRSRTRSPRPCRSSTTSASSPSCGRQPAGQLEPAEAGSQHHDPGHAFRLPSMGKITVRVQRLVTYRARGQGKADDMAPRVATNTTVERAELLEFLRPRHHGLLATTRSDGRPQLSPVACGVDAEGRHRHLDLSAARQDAQRPPRPAGLDLRALRRLGRPVGPGRRHRRGARHARGAGRASSSTTAASPASTRTGTSTAPRCTGRTSR